MRKEETSRSHKWRSESREIRRADISYSISSHYCKSVVKRSQHKEDTDHKRHHRNEKDIHHPPDRHSRANQRQDSESRREWRRRNSPVELVRGCQNTDTSSSSDESEIERRQGKEKHSSYHRKREHEETFEELSRRKRRIESELNALDAEEAAAKEQERRQRSNNRNHSTHKRTEHSRRHHEEKPVRIKQEPLSDDDRQRRRHHSSEIRRQGNDSRSHDENANWGRPEEQQQQQKEQPKEKPNFQTSGKLAEDTNTYNGVVIKYNEPSEARKPKRKWRLYPFKGDVSLPFIPIHRQSAYLLGRTRHIADIPIDHPSCSKQHAVLQFRLLPYEREDGTKGRSVRPYIIDLDSSNGTYVNNKRIEPRRYVELLEKDVLKFGFSTRVYVILHEDSKNEDDDDVERS